MITYNQILDKIFEEFNKEIYFQMMEEILNQQIKEEFKIEPNYYQKRYWDIPIKPIKVILEK